MSLRIINPLFFLLILIAALLFAACAKDDTSPLPPMKQQISSESFVIALLPEQNVFQQKRRYLPLAEYLSKALGMKVRTKLLDSYDAIYNEMIHNKVDAAFFGSLSYVAMDSKIDIEPLARPELMDGTSTYKGVVFAYRGKGITGNVATWKEKRIALVNRSTTAGYIFPKWYLHKNGADNFEHYFKKIIFAGSHDAAIISVLKGDADIGCAKDQILNKIFQENPKVKEELVILAVSAAVPSNTLGVRADTDPKLKEKLKDALVAMDKTSEGRHALSSLGAARFINTKENEYRSLFEMLNALAINPGAFTIEAE